jgi:RNA polymerase sigma-70 factor, ECF subfamily
LAIILEIGCAMTRNVHDPEPAPSDVDLFARVQRGERDCFTVLVARYQAALLRVARSRLGRQDWAEEVVQETFLAAYRGAASFDCRYGFRTWLWTILLNQCHAHYQRRVRSVPLEPWPDEREPVSQVAHREASEGSPLAALLIQERSEKLELLLGELSVVQADALRLRFFGGLKFQEIAEAMQCSLNTAKNRVRWGLMRMSELLQAGAEGTRRCEAEREPEA